MWAKEGEVLEAGGPRLAMPPTSSTVLCYAHILGTTHGSDLSSLAINIILHHNLILAAAAKSFRNRNLFSNYQSLVDDGGLLAQDGLVLPASTLL